MESLTLEHGERFGRLTVLGAVKTKKHGTRYRCGCACGNSGFLTKATRLMRGVDRSCGRCRDK